jgi:hypothetical protein
MEAELTLTDYAFLILLNDVDQEISNTEMKKLYQVRLISPDYERLNAAGCVTSKTKGRPYKHTITDAGKEIVKHLRIDSDRITKPAERVLWAAMVVRGTAGTGRISAAIAPAVDLDERIRAAYAKLAEASGAWVDLTAVRPLFDDVSKNDLDTALIKMLDQVDVRLEPEPLKHRVGAHERSAAVRVGAEDRHKLSIGRR